MHVPYSASSGNGGGGGESGAGGEEGEWRHPLIDYYPIQERVEILLVFILQKPGYRPRQKNKISE